MECNKDEAIRAKTIAEKKMLTKDYTAARKLLLTAQRLHPELENASQMLTVCEVHCSAEAKVSGSEDWYGILQVEPTADEGLIKKQYRKLALLLHPDKNKFAGAEAAFKLIGEAHRILSDKTNRSIYDHKRNAQVRVTKSVAPKNPRKQAPPPAPRAPANRTQTAHPMPHQHPFTAMTFWTMCPFCGIRYQYYRTILNKGLRCQSCLNPFIAVDVEAQGVPGSFGSSGNPPSVPPQGIPRPQAVNNAVPKTKIFGAGSSGEKVPEEKKEVKVEESNEGSQKMKSPSKPPPPSPPIKSKKRSRKMMVESESESDDSDAEETLGKSNGSGTGTNRTPRRSSRQRQSVSYKEKNSDGEDQENPSGFKRLKKKSRDSLPEDDKVDASINVSSDGTLPKNSDVQDGHDCNSNGADTNETKVDMTFLNYPDPEFYDFDKDRSPERFSVGQIWSLYDFLDGMPRFYAIIRSVSTSRFKVKFTWLEYFPLSEAEENWADEELPAGCGQFKLGKTESAEDSRVFSHLMPWSKASKKNQYIIHPLKGQVWALFKNWDIKWSVNPDEHRSYDYDIVEVISDLSSSDSVIEVCPLVKVKGFVSLFCRSRREGSLVHVSREELLRFSHMVPYYRMTGKEREGVPSGFFELDYASLPSNVEQACLLLSLEEATVGYRPEEELEPEVVDASSSADGEDGSPKTLSPPRVVYEGSEFHDFEVERAKEKFEAGQIWALYCEDDGFPKYYAIIKKVEPKDRPEAEAEGFKVHLNWLEVSPQSEPEFKWLEHGLPLGCGRFRLVPGKEGKETYSTLETFSHLVHPVASKGLSKRQQVFDIYPLAGEVWAVFRNWSADWEQSDLEKCSETADYDIIEIESTSETSIRGFLLEKVERHRAVFKPATSGGERVKLEISEFGKFSHRIPSFRVKEGLLELDQASVPDILLCS